jgi:hypothetical protein
MNEIAPKRIAAYVSQNDLHSGEMTVRETLAFAAKCQGVGEAYGNNVGVHLHFKYIFLVIGEGFKQTKKNI